MKRIIVIFLCIIVTICCLSCDSDVPKSEFSDADARTQSGDPITEIPEVVEYATVADYLHEYKRIEGQGIVVEGIVNYYQDEEFIGLCDIEDGLSTVELKMDSVTSFDMRNYECRYATITGIRHVTDNGNAYIEVTDWQTISGLEEPYWSDTILVTQDVFYEIMDGEVDDFMQRYEFTGIYNGTYFIVLGKDGQMNLRFNISDESMYTVLVPNVRINKPYQFAIENIRPLDEYTLPLEGTDPVECDIVDVMKIQGVTY